MKQYKELLQTIKEKGVWKDAARPNMPKTLSLFGYQFRHNLQEGFPLLTTKKMYWKGVVVELLWFLRGDTNIKYLVDNGVNIWNEDAYQYYVKIASKNTGASWNRIYMPCNRSSNIRSINLEIVDSYSMFTFEEFCEIIKLHSLEELKTNFSAHGYTLGDCGYQYGKVWRDWQGFDKGNFLNTDNLVEVPEIQGHGIFYQPESIDQIKNLIEGLKTNPTGRRHIVTAIDPAHENDLALYWCHAMFQFNCRPLADNERAIKYYDLAPRVGVDLPNGQLGRYVSDQMNSFFLTAEEREIMDKLNIPKYYLDCHLYQRSADVFLGVPFNIASYALLTHIIAKVCNMVAGDFIHSFGDVHIYENHMDAVNLQLSREEKELPKLHLLERHKEHGSLPDHFEKYLVGRIDLDMFLKSLDCYDFRLENYNPHPKIEAELSTGLIK